MKRMKRLIQFVAVAVVVLLVAQPALAGLPCASGVAAGNGCAPDCGMAMGQMSSAQMSSSQMSADCGMSPQISSDGCAQNCCIDRISQGIAQPAAGAKSAAGKTMQFVPAAEAPASAAPVFAHSPRTSFSSTAPPRYILFQVFRI
jgi:hypothetical protein